MQTQKKYINAITIINIAFYRLTYHDGSLHKDTDNYTVESVTLLNMRVPVPQDKPVNVHPSGKYRTFNKGFNKTTSKRKIPETHDVTRVEDTIIALKHTFITYKVLLLHTATMKMHDMYKRTLFILLYNLATSFSSFGHHSCDYSLGYF